MKNFVKFLAAAALCGLVMSASVPAFADDSPSDTNTADGTDPGNPSHYEPGDEATQ